MLYVLGGILVSAILLLVAKNKRPDDVTKIAEVVHGHIVWENMSNVSMAIVEDLKTPSLRASINDTNNVPTVEAENPKIDIVPTVEAENPKIDIVPTVEAENPKIDIDLAVLVLTGRDYKDRRQAIRRTWGNGHSNVYFVIGKHCPYRPDQRKPYVCEPKNPNAKIDANYNTQQERLTVKLKKEPNVVMVDMIDVYRHLATKLHLGYRWVFENTSAKYVLKIDDDSFARVDSISHWLLSRSAPPKYEMLAGKFGIGVRVTRWGKWAEKKYKPDKYPPWPSGSGHIVSRPVRQFLFEHRVSWVSYLGDDTSRVIWMDKVKADMKVTLTTSKHFITHSGDCHDKSKFVIGHDISMAKLRQCYNTMDEYHHVTEDIKLNGADWKKKLSMGNQEPKEGAKVVKDKRPAVNKAICTNKPSGDKWNTFRSIITLLNKLKAEYMISGGTVLFWYRDCNFGDSDIDINIDWDWFVSHVKVLKAALKQNGFVKVHKFGQIDKYGYEEAWKKNGIKVDLFTQARVNGKYISGTTIHGIVYPCYSFFERYAVHSWNSLEFRVPEPIEPYLKKKYGNWRIPERGYHWARSPFKRDNGSFFCDKAPMPVKVIEKGPVQKQKCCLATEERCKWHLDNKKEIPKCEKENLLSLLRWIKSKFDEKVEWYLTAGTLLGVARNNSHIPYETDIDIMVSKKTFEHAINLIRKSIGTTHYKLDSASTPARLFFSSVNTIHVDLWQGIYNHQTEIAAEYMLGRSGFGYYTFPGLHNIIFPTKECEYESETYPCPNDYIKWVQMRFGKDWIIPKRKYGQNSSYKDGKDSHSSFIKYNVKTN